MGQRDRRRAERRLRHRDPNADKAALPDATQEEGTERFEQIQHIVLVMMENHSFDNYFGGLGHGDGALAPGADLPVNVKANGAAVPPFHLSSTVQYSGVPTQTWHASHLQYDDGRNDGFVHSIEETVPNGDPRVPMGYWRESDLPFYAGLATTFTLADRWFCSLLGPTFPNRRFFFAATANGLIDDVPTGMLDYPKTGTIFDLLDRHGITWTNYHHVNPYLLYGKRILGTNVLLVIRRALVGLARLVPQLLTTVQGNMQFTADLYPLGVWRCRRHLRNMKRFFTDAAAGKLPRVCIVDPDFRACSEENPQDVQIGEGFAAAVINAVMHGPGWPGTVLIWLYDEHGGYFDHVPPPAAAEPDEVLPRSLLTAHRPIRWLLGRLGDWNKLEAADSGPGRYDRLGFRVPAVVVSPFSRPGQVSSTVYDHTSALRLIEEKWNLPPLTKRDAAATAPWDMLDLDDPALLRPPDLPAPARPWQPNG